MQSLEHTVKDPRLSSIQWKEHTGDYGPYQSAFTAENTWLANLIKENANAKGYLLDQEGMYKYKLSPNGDFINRYKKSKAEQGRAPTDPSIVEQRREDRKGLEQDDKWERIRQRQDERDARFEEMHEESMKAYDNMTFALTELTSVFREYLRKEYEK